MPGSSTHVFVSYSHADAPLVEPVVSLLRANRSLVFRDADSIRPGERWRSAVSAALAQSELVVVFWCGHALRSEEVSREWMAAVDQGKDVLPLLLDATPLPPELGDYQWIDFRGTVGPGHAADEGATDEAPSRTVAPSAPREAAPRRARPWPGIAGAALAVILTVGVGLLTLVAPEAPPPGFPPQEGQPAEVVVPVLPIALAVAALVLAGLFLLRRRGAPLPRQEAPARPPEQIERRIAEAVQEEILRRAGSRERRPAGR